MVREEIKICSSCDGRGQVYERVAINEKEKKICSNCEGSGRIMVKTTTESFPYKS